MAGRDLFSLWNAWATQILVLLSLLLQIVLLLFARICRREASSLLMFILWLAYLLADSTAIYALGQLALNSVSRDHKLVAFWAPFLLLHHGGPDNITAYALQDNELWWRHLVNLIIQVVGAGYVLYKRIIVGGETSLLVATVLMFVVGLVKYCERTWALMQSNFTSIRSSVKELPGRQLRRYKGHLQYGDHQKYSSDEFLLQCAHSLFHICKRGIVDSVMDVNTSAAKITKTIIKELMEDDAQNRKMWKVMEMELSLMYDILYTKAGVIHTSIGYCIRALSPVFIATAFLLFHFSGSSRDSQNGVDVIVSYILLGGAPVMETISLLTALGSGWVFSFLCGIWWGWLQHAALCKGRWYRFRREVVNLRRIVTGGLLGRSRSGPSTIGQFNLLYFSAAQIYKCNRHLGSFANKLGYEDLWQSVCYSWKITIPDMVKARAVIMPNESDINTMGLLRYKWDKLVLTKDKYPRLVGMLKALRTVDFHETIITWHIATELILAGIEINLFGNVDKDRKGSDQHVYSIRAISNYLMFLLVTQPDMLPGLPQNWLYQMTCQNLYEECEKHHEELIASGGNNNLVFRVLLKLLLGDNKNSTTMVGLNQTSQLAKILLKIDLPKTFDSSVPRLTYACRIAKQWLQWNGEGEPDHERDPVKVLLNLWTSFLIYAANRCNRESHAKKLNTGGEFTTAVWLMVEHIYQTKERKTAEHNAVEVTV